MKVLWFSNSPCGSIRRHGGSAIIGGWLISLEDELKKQCGVDLSVAYLSGVDESPFDYEGTHYYPIYNGRGATKLQKLLFTLQTDKDKERRALPRMLQVIDHVRPDIVHIHGSEDLWGCVAPYVKDIPVVFSIQGLISPCMEKYFSGIPQKTAFSHDRFRDRLMHGDIRTSWASFVYRSEREHCYLSNARYLFGRTFWDERCTLAYNPNRRYHVVNEIMRKPFYQKKWKGDFSQNSPIKIVTTISSGIYKGMETALKAAALLKRYAPFEFEWHIAGYDAHSKWVSISEVVAKVKAKDCKMILHGRVPADELAELLCSSDIYAHVSHIENSSNSVCEAMLVGMPVVATYAGGTASLLKHEEQGMLVQDGDPYVLAGTIIDMVQNLDRTKQYAEAARESALRRHNPERIVRELLEGYNHILCDFAVAKPKV